MKQLIVLRGTMGAGKTAICQHLLQQLAPAVWLDGDWCWNMAPFVPNEENKAMVMDNICALLSRFLACPELDNVVFGWVLHQQQTIDAILERLPLEGVEVCSVSLLASPKVLRDRVVRDIARGVRDGEAISHSMAYLPLYEKLDTWKIHTDHCTPGQAAAQILRLLEQGESEG